MISARALERIEDICKYVGIVNLENPLTHPTNRRIFKTTKGDANKTPPKNIENRISKRNKKGCATMVCEMNLLEREALYLITVNLLACDSQTDSYSLSKAVTQLRNFFWRNNANKDGNIDEILA